LFVFQREKLCNQPSVLQITQAHKENREKSTLREAHGTKPQLCSRNGSTNTGDKQRQNGGGAESDASDWVS